MLRRYKNITWNKYRKDWTVRITILGKRAYIGGFNVIEDAINARDEALCVKKRVELLHPTYKINFYCPKTLCVCMNDYHYQVIIRDNTIKLTRFNAQEMLIPSNNAASSEPPLIFQQSGFVSLLRAQDNTSIQNQDAILSPEKSNVNLPDHNGSTVQEENDYFDFNLPPVESESETEDETISFKHDYGDIDMEDDVLSSSPFTFVEDEPEDEFDSSLDVC